MSTEAISIPADAGMRDVEHRRSASSQDERASTMSIAPRKPYQ